MARFWINAESVSNPLATLEAVRLDEALDQAPTGLITDFPTRLSRYRDLVAGVRNFSERLEQADRSRPSSGWDESRVPDGG